MRDNRRFSLKMRKTILHLTCMKSTKYGGIEHYIIETARQCNKYGYKTVVQYDDLPRSNDYLNDLDSVGAVVAAMKLKLNPLKLARLIVRIRPEIIHIHFANKVILYENALIAKILGVRKNIAMLHGLPETSKISFIRKHAYKRYDWVLCVSDAVRKYLINAGINCNIVSTLYLGSFNYVQQSRELRDQFRNEFGISSRDKVFACIAFDNPQKGLDVLMKAFQKVNQQYSDVHLIIIGIDPDKSQLPIMASDLGISERVHWAGIRDEGWRVLNAADVFVLPCRWGEGQSLATIEAMALKLPVVSTSVAGPAEIVLHRETGVLCIPDDVDSLAKALNEMLSQSEQWNAMGAAGHKRYLEMLQGEKSVEALAQNYYFA